MNIRFTPKIPILTLISVFLFAFYTHAEQTTLSLSQGTTSAVSYTDKEILLGGTAELHLTGTTQLLTNSVIRLDGDRAMLYIDNLRPAAVISGILPYVFVGTTAAVNKSTVRVAIYKQGTVIMAQGAGFKPLTVFKEPNCQGDSASYGLFSKYQGPGLGTGFDNAIRSFKLRKGYMATLATTSDGTGYSRVFIADKEDLVVNILQSELDKMISFVRILNWEWTSKKGWCGTGSGCITDCEKVDGTWSYSWSADQNSSAGVEYVPIRQNGGWPSFSEISGKQYVSHVLGFNEPDHTEQSNLTVAQALAQWPDMMRTGLRIGSPACTNFNWLYQFLDSCKARNYRVDFIAIHAYWGGKTPSSWYNDLKYIHERSGGRPIWITEWNNGANWTTEWWPDSDHSLSTNNAAKQLTDIKNILQVLDTAHFIERYSIYNWVQDCRAILLNGNLTPAGEYYKANKPAVSFNRINEVLPTYSLSKPTLGLSVSGKSVFLGINDPNGEFFRGFVAEKKSPGGTWETYSESDIYTQKIIKDTLDVSQSGSIRYRLRSKRPDGTLSEYSNEVGIDVTQGTDVQVGQCVTKSTGWNPVYFNKGFSGIPAIIVGGATNKNSSILFTTRAKLVDFNTSFSLQMIPWAYQKVSTVPLDETINYLACSPGDHDFGGLRAYAGKGTAASSWTTITFPTPFDTIPVVMTSQLASATSYPTTVRIRNVSKTGFEARLMKETANTSTLASETISYVAIEPGQGVIENHKTRVGFTNTNALGYILASVQYGDSLANPLFIGQMQTCNDDTTATLRVQYVGPKYANVMKQREKSSGQTTIKSDTGGFIVIDLDSNAGVAVKPVTKQNISIYPNPASDWIVFGKQFDKGTMVSVYNMQGALVQTVHVIGDRMNISNLPAGCYLLRSAEFGTAKIVKR